MMRILGMIAAALSIAGCGGSDINIGCPGDADGGQSGTISCGPGTKQEGSQCVAEQPDCSGGLVLRDGRCELPIAVPDFTTFLARSDLTMEASIHTWDARFVLTDLSASSSKAWCDVASPMVGTGNALHVAIDNADGFFSNNFSETFTIQDDTLSDGSCRPQASEILLKQDASTGARAGFFSWNGALGVPRVCAKAGSVRIEGYNDVPMNRANVSLNIQFGDGTVLQKTYEGIVL